MLLRHQQIRGPRRSWRALGEAGAAGVAAAGCYVLAQLIGGRAPFGPRVAAVNDMGDQFVPMHAQLWDVLHGVSAGDLFFSWSSAGGHPFLPDYVAYLASPINLVLLLVPRSGVEAAVTAAVILRLALAAAAMAHALRRLRPDGPAWAFVLLGAAYGTCAWAVDDASYVPMWLDGFVGLPVLLLAGLWARDGHRPIAGTLAVTLVWWSNFYTASMATIGAAALLAAAFAADAVPGPVWRATAARLTWRTATGGMLAGVVLIPELTAIRSSITASATEVSAALPLAPYLPRLLPFSEGAGISPSLGFGTLPLLAALSVPLHPGLTRRQRIVLPLAVATLVAWTCLPAGFLAWHWGIVPNGSPWRQAFVLAGFGCVLAGYAVSAARPLPFWRAALPAAGVAALAWWVFAGPQSARLASKTVPWTALAGAAFVVATLLAQLAWRPDRQVRARAGTRAARWLAIAAVSALVLGEQTYGAFVLGRARDARIPGSYVWAAESDRVSPAVAPWRADGGHWPRHRLGGRATTGLNGENDGMLYGVPATSYYSSTMQAAVGEMWIGLGAPYAANGRIIFSADDPGLGALMGVNGYLRPDGTVAPRAALPVVRLQPPGSAVPGEPPAATGGQLRGGAGSAVYARRNAAIGRVVYDVPGATAVAAETSAAAGAIGADASPVDLSRPRALDAGDRLTVRLPCRPGTIPQVYAPGFVGSWVQGGTDAAAATHLQPPDWRRRGVESGVPVGPGGATLTLVAAYGGRLPADPFACLDPVALRAAIDGAVVPAGSERVALQGSRMEVDLGAPAHGTLVVATADQPGWACEADSSQVTPTARGGLFAVALTGQRSVRCTFTPPGLRWGVAASLAGALMLLGSMVVSRRRGPLDPGDPGNPSPAPRTALGHDRATSSVVHSRG